MSCSPCGYTYTTTPQILMTGQHPSVHFPTGGPATMPPESLLSAAAGNPLCPLPSPYEPGRLVGPYPRIQELYAAGAYSDHVAAAYHGHHPVLYPASLGSPYDMKDPRTGWAAIPTSAGYDPILAAYAPYGDRFDPVDSEARRRNATRETTSTLKAWLNEHRKNPYPTKGEKIMLAIITKMTLTQVSTWFANARRRLKKENKMTWEPRNKTGDDLDDVSIDEDDDKDDDHKSDDEDNQKNRITEPSSVEKKPVQDDKSPLRGGSSPNRRNLSDLDESITQTSPNLKLKVTELSDPIKPEDPIVVEKPKIWSLAQTATSNSPPTLRKQQFADHQTELNSRLRRSLYPSEVTRLSPYHRPMPRLSNDSSAESSLSSPPLWKSGEHAAVNQGDKYGRLTPLDSSDVVSVSPSSTESSSMVPSSTEQSSALSPSLSYSRMLNGRFMPCEQSGLRPSPMDYSQFYSSQVGPTLDMRTLHPAFIRTSAFPYPVGFTCAPQMMYHTHPITTLSRTKCDDDSRS